MCVCVCSEYAYCMRTHTGFSGGSDGEESACDAGDLGWEDPLEKGKALQYSGLENPMDCI